MEWIQLVIKKVCLCLLLSSVIFGDTLDDKVRNLIGDRFYSLNKNFIDRLFKDKESFYEQDIIDIKKVVEILKDNGLLILKFDKPSDLNITFVSQTTPILLARSINSALSSMGYSYFAVSQAQYVGGIATITFNFSTEHALDPSIIISELNKRGYIFNDIKRKSIKDWEYNLKLLEPKLASARDIFPTDVLEVAEVSGEYWFALHDSGNITIVTKARDWRPRIVFYDKNLQIVDLITQNTPVNKVAFSVLEGVSFIMVSDIQNPANVKNGIRIEFEDSHNLRNETK